MKFTILLMVVVISKVFSAPAAKEHVKKVADSYIKYTSKLKTVVELNFTMGFNHRSGKPIISEALDRIGAQEGFEVIRFIGGADGSVKGEIPDFDLADLQQGQVIYANNISMWGSTILGAAKQEALETAIGELGIGYLGFHGSGDNNQNGWPWYTNSLHPMNYAGHGSRDDDAPVYPDEKVKNHVVLENLFKTVTQTGSVKMGLDENGNEIIRDNVAHRRMENEWYRFRRDISTDAAYADKVTILTRYDWTDIPDGTLGSQYKRTGGNMFTYIFEVGNSRTSYFPPGHDDSEMYSTQAGQDSFDQGSGDMDQYLINILYYLANYDPSICDATCDGLPIVDDTDQLTGQVYTSTGIRKNMEKPNILSSSISARGKHSIEIRNVRGDMVFSQTASSGKVYHLNEYKPGVYIVKIILPELTSVKKILIQ